MAKEKVNMCKAIEDIRLEGRAEGYAEAEAKAAARELAVEKAILMIRNGKLTFDEIASFTDLSLEKVERLASLIA